MSIEWSCPPEWLYNAWFKIQKTDDRSQLTVSGNELRVTALPKGGAGMRISKFRIESTGSLTFEVSDGLRCFIKKCLAFQIIHFRVQNEELVLSVDSPGLGIQYKFPKIKIVEENVIPPHDDDQHQSISTKDWISMWPTCPPKGSVTIVLSKQTKIMTLKHSGGRWGAAITMKNKPNRDQTIQIDSSVAKSVFINDWPGGRPWATIVFMHVGVLQWFTPDVTIYVAPIE